MIDQQFTTPHDAFAELDRLSFGDLTLGDALERIAAVSANTVPGVVAASVTLLGRNGAHTTAHTGKTDPDLEMWQYQSGHGPSLAAAAATVTVTIPDTAGGCRWPEWAERALDAGVHSSLSVGLPLRDSVSGALNLYAAEPQVFDEDAVILAETFAGYAAVAMAHCPRPAGADITGNPWASAADHLVLEQARGIIMAERHCNADHALGVLRRMAAQSRRTVPDVAKVLVARAGWPTGA